MSHQWLKPMTTKTQRAKPEPFKLIHGSGNVFRDFGYPNADVLQTKALLAAEILKTLDREKLSMRQAHARTGIAAADFSRICTSDLSRFTVDRLMTVVNKLGTRIEMSVQFKPASAYSTRQEATKLVEAEPKAKYGSNSAKK